MYVETYTYEDYKKWEGDWELIDGVPLAMTPSPISIHQIISGKFYKELEEIIDECEDCFVMIEEDYIVKEDTVLKPDVAVVCNEDIYSFIKNTPKLIAEVVSPSTIKRDEKIKFEKSVNYPTIGAHLEYGFNGNKLNNLDLNKDYYTLAIGLEYKIFDGAKGKNDIQKSKIVCRQYCFRWYQTCKLG